MVEPAEKWKVEQRQKKASNNPRACVAVAQQSTELWLWWGVHRLQRPQACGVLVPWQRVGNCFWNKIEIRNYHRSRIRTTVQTQDLVRDSDGAQIRCPGPGPGLGSVRCKTWFRIECRTPKLPGVSIPEPHTFNKFKMECHIVQDLEISETYIIFLTVLAEMGPIGKLRGRPCDLNLCNLFQGQTVQLLYPQHGVTRLQIPLCDKLLDWSSSWCKSLTISLSHLRNSSLEHAQ